jgi:addiction module HigA family antidote
MPGINLQSPSAGEILQKEFMDELGLSQNALARAIDVPANRIHAIVHNLRRITADTDLRLCKFFGLSEGYFLRLQTSCEIMTTKRSIASALSNILPYDKNIRAA